MKWTWLILLSSLFLIPLNESALSGDKLTSMRYFGDIVRSAQYGGAAYMEADGYIYIYISRNCNSNRNNWYRFDPVNNVTSTISSPSYWPYSTASNNIVTYEGKIYYTQYADLIEFNPSTSSSSKIYDTSHAYAQGLTIDGDRIYVMTPTFGYVWDLGQSQVVATSNDFPDNRGYGPCSIVLNGLWWFTGGVDTSTTDTTIYGQLIGNINANDFDDQGDLLDTVRYTTCVGWQDYIYVFGGYQGSQEYGATIHVFDTSTVTPDTAATSLRMGRKGLFAAYVDNEHFYVMGGVNSTQGSGGTCGGASMERSNLVAYPTQDPTPKPTRSPNSDPTVSPTTFSPTEPPIPRPTIAPTPKPTGDPTLTPTASPQAAPTRSPSKAPTTPPTMAPTKSPTMSPSMDPTMAPTGAPTAAPTDAPTPDVDGDWTCPFVLKIQSDYLERDDFDEDDDDDAENIWTILRLAKQAIIFEIEGDSDIDSLPHDWTDYFRVYMDWDNNPKTQDTAFGWARRRRRRLLDRETTKLRLIADTDYETLANLINGAFTREASLETMTNYLLEQYSEAFDDNDMELEIRYKYESPIYRVYATTSTTQGPGNGSGASNSGGSSNVANTIWFWGLLITVIIVMYFTGTYFHRQAQRGRDKGTRDREFMKIKMATMNAAQTNSGPRGPANPAGAALSHALFLNATKTGSGGDGESDSGDGEGGKVTGMLENMLKAKAKANAAAKPVGLAGGGGMGMGMNPAMGGAMPMNPMMAAGGGGIGGNLGNYLMNPAMMNLGMNPQQLSQMAQWQTAQYMKKMQAQGKQVNPMMMSTDALNDSGEAGGGGDPAGLNKPLPPQAKLGGVVNTNDGAIGGEVLSESDDEDEADNFGTQGGPAKPSGGDAIMGSIPMMPMGNGMNGMGGMGGMGAMGMGMGGPAGGGGAMGMGMMGMPMLGGLPGQPSMNVAGVMAEQTKMDNLGGGGGDKDDDDGQSAAWNAAMNTPGY